LQFEHEGLKSPTTDLSEESELFTDILQGIVPFARRRRALIACTGNKLSDKIVRNEADKHCYRKRDCSKDKGYAPLCPTEPDGRQGTGTNKYNKHLSADRDEVDANKEPVSENTFEDIELVIEAAIAGKTSA
jgi:hypothetical protein